MHGDMPPNPPSWRASRALVSLPSTASPNQSKFASYGPEVLEAYKLVSVFKITFLSSSLSSQVSANFHARLVSK